MIFPLSYWKWDSIHRHVHLRNSAYKPLAQATLSDTKPCLPIIANAHPFLYELQHTYRTLGTNFICYEIFKCELYPIRTFSMTNFSRYEPYTIRTLSRTNICIKATSYEHLAIPTSSLVNFSIRTVLWTLSVTKFLIRTISNTNFLLHEHYPIRISVYEHLLTNLCLYKPCVYEL